MYFSCSLNNGFLRVSDSLNYSYYSQPIEIIQHKVLRLSIINIIVAYARPSDSSSQMTIPGSSAKQGAGMNLQSLQRKVDLGEQLLAFFDKVEGKGSFIRGKMIMN